MATLRRRPMRIRIGVSTCAVAALLCLWMGMAECHASRKADEYAELRAQFETRYQKWRTALDEWIARNSSCSYTAILPEQRQITDMGLKAVPFIIEVLDADLKGNVPGIGGRIRGMILSMLWRLTPKHFSREDWPAGKTYGDPTTEAQLYVDWWRDGRKQTPKEFDKLCAELNRLPRDAPYDPRVQAVLKRMGNLGTDIMPQVVEKTKKGDERLLWLAGVMIEYAGVKPDEFIVNGRNTWSSATLLKWWKKNKERLTFPEPPTEDAKH